MYYIATCTAFSAGEYLLKQHGVLAGIHYPVPVHLQPAYRHRLALGPAGCTETASAAGEVFSLPIYTELTDAEVERICAALRDLGC